MSNAESNLRVVIFENPYQFWDEPQVNQLFTDLITLKLRGYRNAYAEGVLPIDTCDYLGAHLLICRERRGRLIPLTGIRSTTLKRAKQHGLAFPGLSLVRSAGAREHEIVLQKLVERCDSDPSALAYAGSWTMDPGVRRDPELVQALRELFMATYYFYHLENGIREIVIGGTLRFKTERLFESWGHRPLMSGTRLLPTIHVPTLLGEEVQVMHLERFSDDIRRTSQKLRSAWENRLVLAAPVPESEIRAA